MNYNQYKVLVPELTKFKNKQINSLTKTNNPSKRNKVPTISLVPSAAVQRPKVELNINLKQLKNAKNANKIISGLETEIKKDKNMIEKIKKIKKEPSAEENRLNNLKKIKKEEYKRTIKQIETKNKEYYAKFLEKMTTSPERADQHKELLKSQKSDIKHALSEAKKYYNKT